MSRTRAIHTSIYSTLDCDPLLTDLIAEFVGEMPGRVTRLRRLLADQDWTMLRRTAHQLKGAAGSYGFQPISHVAAQLEAQVIADADYQEIAATVQELAALCQAATAAVPPR